MDSIWLERSRSRGMMIKFKECEWNINPRLYIRDFVSLGLDPESVIGRFYATLYPATQFKLGHHES
jgi:hypothetical protein